MFTVGDRDRLRVCVVGWAQTDPRVVSGAEVGSLALQEGDRWSDLDLTFAIAEGASLWETLEDWTQRLAAEFGATHLFDLPSGTSLYRVFLLPNALQFDLSFTPEATFGAVGSKFRLLFGTAIQKPIPQPPHASDLFGYAAHHALRARFCIERGRFWHAEYWLSGARDYALSLACLRYHLPVSHGRGYDDLPEETLSRFRDTFAPSLERNALLRALSGVIEGLIGEASAFPELATKAEAPLRILMNAWETL